MKLKIYFENEQDKEIIRYSMKILLRHAILETLAYEGEKGACEVSVTFTDNEKIRVLNRRFREIDRATDVLSFPLFEDGEGLPDMPEMLGDVVLSLERAREQAEEFGHSFEREVAFLTVHSILHLLGYDHETSEAAELDMRRRQSEIMEKLGLSVKTGDNK